MARMDLRVRAFAWLTRRQSSVAGKTEEQVIAMQSREFPAGRVTDWIFGATAPGVDVTSQSIPGPGGQVPVRVYRPAGPVSGTVASGTVASGTARPLVLYFHGGGFVFGDIRMGDWLCSRVAAGVGAVVVSVDYRLAPTHRFPCAIEDCYAALTWAAAHAADLGAGGPVTVMGESAGGNLSAVMCLRALEREGPAIAHQALLYPSTDMTEAGSATASARANPNAPFLSGAEMTVYRTLYLGPDGDRANPMASPMLAKSHAGLPPALIVVAEHDPLRDDGVRYADALRAAGVPVKLTEYPGMPHGFLNFPGLCRGARPALAELIAEQRTALAAAPAERRDLCRASRAPRGITNGTRGRAGPCTRGRTAGSRRDTRTVPAATTLRALPRRGGRPRGSTRIAGCECLPGCCCCRGRHPGPGRRRDGRPPRPVPLPRRTPGSAHRGTAPTHRAWS
jgi:acetyl esterase